MSNWLWWLQCTFEITANDLYAIHKCSSLKGENTLHNSRCGVSCCVSSFKKISPCENPNSWWTGTVFRFDILWVTENMLCKTKNMLCETQKLYANTHHISKNDLTFHEWNLDFGTLRNLTFHEWNLHFGTSRNLTFHEWNLHFGTSRNLTFHEWNLDFGTSRNLTFHEWNLDFGTSRNLTFHEWNLDFGTSRNLTFHEWNLHFGTSRNLTFHEWNLHFGTSRNLTFHEWNLHFGTSRNLTFHEWNLHFGTSRNLTFHEWNLHFATSRNLTFHEWNLDFGTSRNLTFHEWNLHFGTSSIPSEPLGTWCKVSGGCPKPPRSFIGRTPSLSGCWGKKCYNWQILRKLWMTQWDLSWFVEAASCRSWGEALWIACSHESYGEPWRISESLHSVLHKVHVPVPCGFHSGYWVSTSCTCCGHNILKNHRSGPESFTSKQDFWNLTCRRNIAYESSPPFIGTRSSTLHNFHPPRTWWQRLPDSIGRYRVSLSLSRERERGISWYDCKSGHTALWGLGRASRWQGQPVPRCCLHVICKCYSTDVQVVGQPG